MPTGTLKEKHNNFKPEKMCSFLQGSASTGHNREEETGRERGERERDGALPHFLKAKTFLDITTDDRKERGNIKDICASN